jgi:hypothetical protein
MGRFVTVVGLVVLGVATLFVAWVLGMRNKGSFVVAAQRRFNRAVVNPRALRTAGTPGSAAAVIRHTGASFSVERPEVVRSTASNTTSPTRAQSARSA